MVAALPVPRYGVSGHPLDLVEKLAAANDWFIDRSCEDEVTLVVGGSWCDLHLTLAWRGEMESLLTATSFDIKVPEPRRAEVAQLVNLINEQLLFGHFDIWQQEGSLMFRDSLLLAGGSHCSPAQCEGMIALAIEACELYYPAFQFVIWAGTPAAEAIQASLLETAGQA